MTKISRLNNNLESIEQFISTVKDRDIMVYEDVQGSKVFCKWTGSKFIIAPKSINNEPINIIDLVTQKFYNMLYYYMHTLPENVTNLLNKTWWFCFEYFPDDTPANVKYSKLPKNNLILTCIVKGSKYTYNYDEMIEYSDLFRVSPLPVLFKGKLNDKQIEAIELFLKTSEDDLKFIFNETNFSKFLYLVLNPAEKNSYLMNEDEFNDNLEKIVIKINNDWDISFELLNPLYQRNEQNNNTEYTIIYSLILVKFLEFLQISNIDGYKLKNTIRELLYIELMCKLFNDFMGEVKHSIKQWDIVVPKFFQDDKFKINIDLVNNDETKVYINSSEKIEYVFKVLLSSFCKYRKNPIGVFTEQTVILFNQTIDKINKYIEKIMGVNLEYKIQKKDVKNTKDYFNLDYNLDSTGAVYPDVNKYPSEVGGGEKKKMKGKIDFGTKEVPNKK